MRVAVVGGGAAGSSCAWWLARRGVDVTLYEQFGPGHTKGSSHGRSRIFRFAYPDQRWVRMAIEALPLWRELEDDAGVALLETTGGIDHGEPTKVAAVEAALGAAGARSQRLPAAAAQERWPHMRFAGDVLLQPDAGRIDADATVSALQRRAGELGADIRHGHRVESVEELDADVVVVTAGAWMPKLVELPRPVKVTQEQVFHFDPRTPDTEWPSFIHYRDPFVYGLETPGEGIKVAEHHTGPEVDPDRRSFAVDAGGRRRVEEYVADWLPGLVPAPVDEVTCLYTSTADEEFVLERHGNVVIGSPCSGHGFKFVPLVGRLLADLVTG
jgi:sarcosine oxidase